MHPLRTAAVFLYEVAARFEAIAVAIEGVPILGEYLAMPFFWVTYFFNEIAYWVDLADDWISAIDFDYIIVDLQQWVMDTIEDDLFVRDYFRRNITGWIMYRLGFGFVDSLLFSYYPIGFIKEKLIEWFPLLGLVLDDPLGWIREVIIDYWPILEGLFDDPIAWVMYRLGADMWEVLAFRDDIPAWIFYRLTGSYVDALFYKWNLIEYVKWKLRSEWPFLEEILFDPIGWLWREFMEAVDTYIDTQIEWVIQTSARVISLIWETRI